MSIKTIRVTKNPLPQPMVRLVQGDANTQVLRFLVKKDYGGKDLSHLIWSVWVQGYEGEAEVSYIGQGTVSGDDLQLDWDMIPAVTKAPGITVLKLYGSNAGAAEKEYAWVSGNMMVNVSPTQMIDPGYDEDEVNEVRQLITDFGEKEAAYKKYTDDSIAAEKKYVDDEIAAEKSHRVELNAEIKNDQEVLGSRLSALEAGTTPEGSEVIGIRTGADGTVYTSAGDAVRGQTNAVKKDLNNTSYAFTDGVYKDSGVVFEQGQLSSDGESDNSYYVRMASPIKNDHGFWIYNPTGYRWSLVITTESGAYSGYRDIGTESTATHLYVDKKCYVPQDGRYYRLKCARTTYVEFTPAQNDVRIMVPQIVGYDALKTTADTAMSYADTLYRVPVIELVNGLIYHTSDSEGRFYDNDNYKRSNAVFLKNGETIRVYGSGASSVWLMCECDSYGTGFLNGLKRGDGSYHLYEYTADHDMYIKFCGQTVYYAGGKNPVVTDAELKNAIIFYKNKYYNPVKRTSLYGKTITLMGDSLAHGNITGNDCVWLHHLALKYNMTEHNMGINGNAFTQGNGSGTPMCERYAQIPESDIIVVEGGANDKGANASIGTATDTEPTTFCGALNTVITGIRTMYPKAKLVFMTDYNRYPSRYRAYADAMLEVCARRSVPCFDNFSSSGIAVTEDPMKAWQDEGYVLTGTANIHFTPEAYRDVLLPKYEAFLLAQ